MLMGLQDAERGQMGITRVQVIVLHTRVPEEKLKKSQKQDQEKEQSRDREKSRIIEVNGTEFQGLTGLYCQKIHQQGKD